MSQYSFPEAIEETMPSVVDNPFAAIVLHLEVINATLERMLSFLIALESNADPIVMAEALAALQASLTAPRQKIVTRDDRGMIATVIERPM